MVYEFCHKCGTFVLVASLVVASALDHNHGHGRGEPPHPVHPQEPYTHARPQWVIVATAGTGLTSSSTSRVSLEQPKMTTE